jgi:hypothetical protein
MRALLDRVARFFFTQHTGTVKIHIPTDNKLYVPKGHKIYQIAVKYSQWPSNMTEILIPRHYKMYPNWDIWHATLAAPLFERKHFWIWAWVYN